MGGKPAGWAKELGGLTFAVVYNSGHMVPYNRPDQAYDLLLRLLEGKKFVDEEAPVIRVERLSPPQPSNMQSSGPSASVLGRRGVQRDALVIVLSMAFGFLVASGLMSRGSTRRRGYAQVSNEVGDDGAAP